MTMTSARVDELVDRRGQRIIARAQHVHRAQQRDLAAARPVMRHTAGSAATAACSGAQSPRAGDLSLRAHERVAGDQRDFGFDVAVVLKARASACRAVGRRARRTRCTGKNFARTSTACSMKRHASFGASVGGRGTGTRRLRTFGVRVDDAPEGLRVAAAASAVEPGAAHRQRVVVHRDENVLARVRRAQGLLQPLEPRRARPPASSPARNVPSSTTDHGPGAARRRGGTSRSREFRPPALGRHDCRGSSRRARRAARRARKRSYPARLSSCTMSPVARIADRRASAGSRWACSSTARKRCVRRNGAHAAVGGRVQVRVADLQEPRAQVLASHDPRRVARTVGRKFDDTQLASLCAGDCRTSAAPLGCAALYPLGDNCVSRRSTFFHALLRPAAGPAGLRRSFRPPTPMALRKGQLRRRSSALAPPAANAIRALSMDAVEAAKSGHPGMPMGMADIAEVLWNDFLQVTTRRTRSGSTATASCCRTATARCCCTRSLHLTGYDLADRRAEEVPPARLAHGRPSRARARARHRDDDGPARPGLRQRRRHGARGEASRGAVQSPGFTTSSTTTPTCSSATAA